MLGVAASDDGMRWLASPELRVRAIRAAEEDELVSGLHLCRAACSVPRVSIRPAGSSLTTVTTLWVRGVFSF